MTLTPDEQNAARLATSPRQGAIVALEVLANDLYRSAKENIAKMEEVEKQIADLSARHKSDHERIAAIADMAQLGMRRHYLMGRIDEAVNTAKAIVDSVQDQLKKDAMEALFREQPPRPFNQETDIDA